MLASSDRDALTIRGAQSNEELRQAGELMAAALDRDGEALHRGLAGGAFPAYVREHTRVALRRGVLVGALRIFSETVRLGEARLRAGGIGLLTAAPGQRPEAVLEPLLADTLRYLAVHGYHMALVFGRALSYQRFGFSTPLPDYCIHMDVVDAACVLCTPHRMRPAKPGDIAAMQRIHHANDAGVPASLLRTQAHIKSRWDDWAGCRVLTDGQGKVFAYIVFGHAGYDLPILEAGAINEEACRCVLAAAAETAAAADKVSLSFRLPPGHPMAHFLLRFPSSHETRIPHDRGGMLALTNIAETLESLIPEWESRLVSKAAREARIEFTIVCEGVPYRIRANRGAIDVATVSGKNKLSVAASELLDLITGAVYAEDLLASMPRLISASARELIAALFPKRNSFIWPLDRF